MSKGYEQLTGLLLYSLILILSGQVGKFYHLAHCLCRIKLGIREIHNDSDEHFNGGPCALTCVEVIGQTHN